MNNKDEYWMKLAIEEAKKGIGSVNPNPCVGAVIVKDDKLISKGYHKKFGDNHAEINAIKNAGVDLTGATLYVTLEPCSSTGKTGPCTEAIINNKIIRVVIGSVDPNKVNQNKALQILNAANIEVCSNILQKECDNLIKVFRKFVTKKLPYVTCKWAMTLDGKIATKNFESKWITSEESRLNVKLERSKHMAVMVGANTVDIDNPTLMAVENKNNPVRIIVDPELITKPDRLIFNTHQISEIIIITDKSNVENASLFKNVTFIFLETNNNKFNLKQMLEVLAKRNIDSIFLEGGSTLNGSMFDSKLVDSVSIYIGNKIIADKFGLGPINGIGVTNINSAIHLENMSVETLGQDVLIKGDIIYV